MTDLEKEFKRLEEREKEIQQSVEELEKEVDFYKKVAWVFISIGFLLATWGIYKMFVPIDDNELSKLGNIGDYVSGTTGAAWSLAGLVLVYVAFLGQKQQLLQQQLDILYNQIELKATRFELEGQKKEMQEQNETLRLQKFESTFFQLIGLFNEIKNRIDPQIQSEASKSYFFTFNFKVYSIYNQGKLINSCSDKPIDIIIRAYIENYNTRQDKVSNYFRTLYHIVNFIDKSTISDEDKKRYAAFIRAQLTPSELQILFYNCMTPFGEKFKPLIEKYHLFNNLSVKSLVENESIVKFYHYSAYGKNLQDYPLNDEHLTK